MKAPLITVDNICMDFDGTHALRIFHSRSPKGRFWGS